MAEKWYIGKNKKGEVFAAKINGNPIESTGKWTLEIYKKLAEGGFQSVFGGNSYPTLHGAVKQLHHWRKGILWVEK